MSKPLSAEQAAKRARVSRWTIARAIQAGRLKGVRDNRLRWRIDPDDLDEWALHIERTEQHTEQAGAAHALHDEQGEQGTEQHGAPKVDAQELAAEVETLRQDLDRLEQEAAAERARAEDLTRDLASERTRAEGLAREVAAERARAEREGVAVDDLRARLTQSEGERRSALQSLEEERRALRVLVERITSPADPEAAPAPRRGFLARLLGT